MIVKNLITYDVVQFKIPSMVVAFSHCSFKCEKEYNCNCQNKSLAESTSIDISYDDILKAYANSKMCKALVLGGLEPFDDFEDVFELVLLFRRYYNDPIVIYTGYNEDEIEDKIKRISNCRNIIVKFGRFIPNQKSHYDKVLGVRLASDNQYAKYISPK